MAITSRNENFWEQRKLGEVSKKLKSYSLTRSVESKTKTKIKYIHYGDIHTGIAQNITVNNKLPWIKLDQSKKIEKLKKGDIIVADASEDYKGIADAALIEESLPYHIIAGLHTIAFRPNNQLMDSKFIFYALQNISFKRYGYKIGTGLKVFGISTNNFFNFNLKFPNILEQNKISTLISKLKNLITLYERKLKLLSQVKKYFLDNLFAEKESPNLRFKGYEDTWLKSKFSKFLSIPEKEKVTIDSPSRILTVKLNLGGVQKGANRTTLKLNSTTYYLRKAGQLIYGKQNLFNGSLAIIPPQFEGYVTSGDVPSLNIDNINKQFLYYYIARKSFYEKTEAYSSGTGSKRIHEKTFLSFNIVYPENLKEQEKISRLISSINSNIKLYCSKKNKLTAIKKKLLNTMFI